MPGVGLEALAQAGAAELQELRRELQAFGRAVEGQLEQAVRQVQPLARALRDLEEEHLSYKEERLSELRLFGLEKRRFLGDIIVVFQYLKGTIKQQGD